MAAGVAAALHSRRAATGLAFDFGVGVEVGAAVDDLHGLEAGLAQFGAVVVDADGAGDAADIGGEALCDRRPADRI